VAIEVMSLILNSDLPISSSVKFTFVGFANHGNADGTEVRPSLARVARYIQAHPRTVSRHLGILQRAGLMELVSEERQHQPAVYRIRVDRLSPLGFSGTTSGAPSHDNGGRSATTPVSTKTSIEPSETSLDLSSDRQFEEFFTVFPTARKGSRRIVRKAWDKAIKRHPAVRIIAKARDYRDDPNRRDEFTKGAAVWLNNDCWEDGPLPSLNGKARRAAELPLDRIARELVEEMNGQHPGKNARDDAARQLSG
jgi:DNA-binding transcriptional ArsR family regulator